MVCTQGQVTLLTSLEELWTLDMGDTRLSPVTGLLTRRVTQMAGGQHHLAAVTDQGQVFTWTEDSVNPGRAGEACFNHTIHNIKTSTSQVATRVGLQMSFCPDRAFLLIFLSGHMTM